MSTILTPGELTGTAHATEKDYWTPKNYEGGSMGIMTLRRGLENSRNLVTAHLLDGGIEAASHAITRSISGLGSVRARSHRSDHPFT